MKKFTLVLLGLGLAVAGACTATPEASQKSEAATETTASTVTTTETSALVAAPKPKARVGSAAVYDQIAAETDCTALQATFDRAETTSKRDGGPPKSDAFVQERYGNWSQIGLAYMKAADQRMQDVGCY